MYDIWNTNKAVAVLGKNIWGLGPSSFGGKWQQRLSEITVEPKKLKKMKKIGGGVDKIGGLAPWSQCRTAAVIKVGNLQSAYFSM